MQLAQGRLRSSVIVMIVLVCHKSRYEYHYPNKCRPNKCCPSPTFFPITAPTTFVPSLRLSQKCLALTETNAAPPPFPSLA